MLTKVNLSVGDAVIRNVSPQDRERLKEVVKKTGAFTEEEINCAVELFDIYLNNPDQKDYDFFCCADNSGALAGYVCCGKAPFTDAAYYLYWIAVHPDFQKLGVGKKLMRHLEETLARKGARMLLLETASKLSYGDTRAFYERNGFTEISRIKDFYAVNDDRVTYGKFYNINNPAMTVEEKKKTTGKIVSPLTPK